jgi:hypothetical protein
MVRGDLLLEYKRAKTIDFELSHSKSLILPTLLQAPFNLKTKLFASISSGSIALNGTGSTREGVEGKEGFGLCLTPKTGVYHAEELLIQTLIYV